MKNSTVLDLDEQLTVEELYDKVAHSIACIAGQHDRIECFDTIISPLGIIFDACRTQLGKNGKNNVEL